MVVLQQLNCLFFSILSHKLFQDCVFLFLILKNGDIQTFVIASVYKLMCNDIYKA